MPAVKLTKTVVDKAHAGDKEDVILDAEVRGVGVKVTPKGAKSFFLQYRTGGRETTSQRYTIGTFGGLTVEIARQEAIKLRGRIAAGDDPCKERRDQKERARSAPTVKTVKTEFKGFKEKHLSK